MTGHAAVYGVKSAASDVLGRWRAAGVTAELVIASGKSTTTNSELKAYLYFWVDYTVLLYPLYFL